MSPVRRPRLAALVVFGLLAPIAVVTFAGAAGAQPGAVAAPAVPAPALPAQPSRPTIREVNARVQALKHHAERASEDYNAARERMRSLKVRISAAEKRAAAQRPRVEAARRELTRIAVELYKSGGLSSLDLLLSDDPDAVLAANGTLISLSDRAASAVRHFSEEQRRLEQDLADIAAQQKRMEQTRRSLEASKKAVEDRLAAARRELSRLGADERARLNRMSRSSAQRSLSQILGRNVSDRPSCAEAGINVPRGRIGKVVSYLCKQLGDPYRWGGAGPDSFDCSGLSQQAWRQAGVSLPHNADMQSRYGRRVSADDLQVGDLVFFYSPISHMGVYVGNGIMIAAPQTGDVVKIQPVRYTKLVAAVRL